MGMVYKAHHVLMDRAVAIKFLLADKNVDQTTLDRFRREAMASAKINHPNACAVTDFGISADNTFYLVMEFLSGRSLRDKLKAEKRLSLSEAAKILVQICAAVEAAHKRNIVHRDLKPDNVFLQKEDGREIVKVIDFGIAKMTNTGTKTIDGLTEAGMIVGTPYYMSPEQCQSDNLGPGADLYSIGVMLFEMITGQLPFSGDSPLAVALKHLSEPPPSPKKYLPELPDEIEAVILRALAKKREDRQESVAQLAREFAHAVGTGTGMLSGDYSSLLEDDPIGGVSTIGGGGRDTTEMDISETGSDKSATTAMSAAGRKTTEMSGNKTKTSSGGSKATKGQSRAVHQGGTLAMGRENTSGGTLAMGSAKRLGDEGEEIVSTSSKTPVFIGGGAIVLIVIAIAAWQFIGKPTSPTNTPTPLTSASPTAPKIDKPGTMIEIAGGTFRMGRDEGKDQFGNEIEVQETPAHQITVKSFLIGKYEVTNREYAEFLQAAGYKAPPDWNPANEGAADQPVTNIDWADADAYCKWLAKKENKPYRLPTEQEWEFAARGEKSMLYAWGALWEPGIANTKDLTGGSGTLLAVISQALTKDISPFGIVAMSGNVSEWTSSDATLYPGNPNAIEKGLKIARGGNYGNAKAASAATTRLLNPPTFRDPHFGFRIAMDKN
ncbi:MAG: SUMF1/EgtB/PvdO family nonheme iron enzyme [Acidobacteria bacterium]|nr:SUMF1/EgtB/PvdO family nonheme iron enzyme [Acidobacteriota bacterium]